VGRWAVSWLGRRGSGVCRRCAMAGVVREEVDSHHVPKAAVLQRAARFPPPVVCSVAEAKAPAPLRPYRQAAQVMLLSAAAALFGSIEGRAARGCGPPARQPHSRLPTMPTPPVRPDVHTHAGSAGRR